MPHRSNFRQEFYEWYRETAHWPRMVFLLYGYKKGWIPKSALAPLTPFSVFLAISIVMLFIGPFPNPISSGAAVGMLGSLVWLTASVSRYSRLALIDVIWMTIPVIVLVWGLLFA